MSHLVRALRHGFRSLVREPGFALTAVFTLALGIGATTALFTVVNAVMLSPIPFPQSDRLIQIWRSELPTLTYGSASYLRFLDWRANQRAFSDIGVWAPRGMTLAGGSGPERVAGATTSASFFNVIGATPVIGRWFMEGEDRVGATKVVVLSAGLWRRRYEGSTAALGASVLLDGEPYTIVGVAPDGFSEVWRRDLWIPLALNADPRSRDINFLLTFGRLRDGMTMDGARRSLADLATQMERDHPEDRYTFFTRTLLDVTTEGATRGLWVLLAATGLLLLIACSNVANLLLARAVVRERALAIHASLGAGRAQLFGQVMGETVAVGLLGSVVGAALAWGLLRIFVSQAPVNFPRLAAITVDARVLGFSLGVALVAGVIAGIAPALHLLRTDLMGVMRGGQSRGATAGRARAANRWLVVCEMALALALVTTAGLMVKSLLRLQSQDLGLTSERVLTFAVGLPPLAANGDEAVSRFQTTFLDKVRALPGVTHAAGINMLPIANTGNNTNVSRTDQVVPREELPLSEVRIVTPGYFDAMGVRVLFGRPIDDRDRSTTPRAVVINQALAAQLWPGRELSSLVGQPIRTGWESADQSREVIGIVAGVRSRRPDAAPEAELYVPFLQIPSPSMTYVVRATGDPAALTGQIRSALANMNSIVALAAVRTFDEVVTISTKSSALLSWLSALFGVLAAALAIVGIYSVMSYTVAQRTREMAIRSAMGAQRATLLALVLREGLMLSVAGIIAGGVLAFAASGVLGALLYDVRATDPAVFAGSAGGLAVIALAGYLIPALRAARVEPVVALRGE